MSKEKKRVIVKKPPLGDIKLLHQEAEGEEGKCTFCGKSKKKWLPMEECSRLLRLRKKLT